MSQIDFAKEVGVAAKYMSDIENGKRNVSIQILCRIANVFNMTLNRKYLKQGDIRKLIAETKK